MLVTSKVANEGLLAERHEQFTFRGEFHNYMSREISDVDRILTVYENPVRGPKHPLPPRRYEAAITLEDKDRVRSAVKDIDSLMRVNRKVGAIVKLPPLRQLTPPGCEMVSILSLAEDHVRSHRP